MTSPYINHFLQPDTVIPDPSNPQSWNRYSYVTNRPVNFNDPTGHAGCDGDYQGSCADWAKSLENQEQGGGGPDPENDDVQCQNDPDCELNGNHDDGGTGSVCYPGELACQLAKQGYDGYDLDDLCPLSATLAYCFENRQPLYMGNGPLYIDSAEWEDFLSAIRDRAHGKSLWWIVTNAVAFDTPFYDKSFYGIPRYTGTGYLNGKYYDRSELNYVAQGELWAAAGASPEVTKIIVRVWKIIPIGHWPILNPSPGTFEMTELGYEHYKELYP